MILQDARQKYYNSSATASEVNRQMGYAGIAAVCLLRVGGDEAAKIPYSTLLSAALLCFVVSLALDVLQYVTNTIIWGFYHRGLEKKGTPEDKFFLAPKEINWLGLGFFYSKVTASLAGAVLLAWHIASHF